MQTLHNIQNWAQQVQDAWGDSSIAHSTITIEDLDGDARDEFAKGLQRELQLRFPDSSVTVRAYGVGDLKVSREPI